MAIPKELGPIWNAGIFRLGGPKEFGKLKYGLKLVKSEIFTRFQICQEPHMPKAEIKSCHFLTTTKNSGILAIQISSGVSYLPSQERELRLLGQKALKKIPDVD